MKKIRFNDVGPPASDHLTLTSRRLGEFALSRGTVVAIAALIILVACVFCFLGARGMAHAEQTNFWPETAATVTNVVKHEHRNREYGTTHYSYTTTLEYSVDGHRYDSKFSKRLSNPQKVFYDPDDPSDCVLRRGVESDGTNVAFYIAIFFGLLGCAVLAISMSPKTD